MAQITGAQATATQAAKVTFAAKIGDAQIALAGALGDAAVAYAEAVGPTLPTNQGISGRRGVPKLFA